MNRYAVVSAYGRDEMTHNLIAQLQLQDTEVIIIDNKRGGFQSLADHRVKYPRYDEDFNYSEAINVGLDYIELELKCKSEYLVAILNDDLILPDYFMDRMEDALVGTGATTAFPDQHGLLGDGLCYLNTSPPGTTYDHARKLTGYAHVSLGSAGLRFDETMKIWASDNDFEMQARQKQGTVMVGGCRVNHLEPDGNYAKRDYWQTQADKDMNTFREKWNFPAW